jgi:hypothetical protein
LRLQLRRRLVRSTVFAFVLIGLLNGNVNAQPRGQEPAPAQEPSTPPLGGSNLDGHVALHYGQYADTDHVFVETPSVAGTVSNPIAGWSVGARYLADVVSAASVDIVSTASRRWTEVRQEGSVDASYKPQLFGVQASAAVSDEPDYLSLSAGAAITQDLANKNATWLLGYAHGHDVAGRTGTPFSVFSHILDRNAINGSLSLVLDRSTVATFVGDIVLENGDQSKPYRYIPLFSPGTFVPRGAPIDLVNGLRASARPLEQLPLSRQRYALTARLAHRYHLRTVRLEERAYADSWLTMATTTDARYLMDLGRRVEMGPHLRLHAQSAVNFWQRAYVLGPGFQVPVLRTGDRELGPLLNVTGGWSLQVGLGGNATPMSWLLGFDLNATSTRYLDDLYITSRISALSGVSLETDL